MRHVDPPDHRGPGSLHGTANDTYRRHACAVRASVRVRSHSRERSSGGAVRTARPRSGSASAAERRAIATHARRCGVPLSAPARRHARRRRPRDEAAAAARLLVAPPPVAPSAAADLEEVAPVRPGSLAIREGVTRTTLRGSRPSVGRHGRGCEPTSLEPPATSLASSDGGARGCGVELGDGRAFPPSASDARSRAGRRGWRRRRRYKNSCRPRMRDKREVRAAWRRPDELTAQPRESAQAGDPLLHSVCFAMLEAKHERWPAHRCTLPFGLRLSVN